MKSLVDNGIIFDSFLIIIIGSFLFGAVGYCCEDTKDNFALKVINDLHKELDDNSDGEVDAAEVEEFAQDELKYKPSSKKSSSFQSSITKDKLWHSWKSSEVYNWTLDDVIIWLTVHIELPEYTTVFRANNITGSLIPRLALSDMSFLHYNLKIINPEHRKKISLNSKELILFGVPEDIERKFFKDKLAFEVIKQLHSQLDDDQDGGVDAQEADEFVRDELKYTSDFDRAKGFNKNDNHISKEELWRNWKSSEVFNWTSDDVLEWLISHVELAEYASIFKTNQINGSTIPRLALSDMSFLIKDLKIKNAVHRKKLLLKSTDLILFGPPKKTHSKMKDAILFTLIILTTGGCWLAFSQHRFSKKQLKNMQDKMNQLGRAEESLCKLQNRLKEAEIQNSRVTSEKLEIEEKLKSEIEKFKEEIFRSDSNEDFFRSKQIDDHLFNQLNLDQGFSKNLKILLQMTYEVEGHFFSIKRLAAEHQMRNVRDMCERLRKKKSTFIGSLKMAHSGNLEDMDKQLSEAKYSIDEVRSDLNERTQRWECIEKITRFKIFPTPGLSALRSSFKSYNNGIACRKPSMPSLTSALFAQMSPINDTVSATNHNTIYSSTRPKSLQFYMGGGGCSGDTSTVVDSPSSLGCMDAVSDMPPVMSKTCSASSSLSQMCSLPSQCCIVSSDHSISATTSSDRKSSNISLVSEAGNSAKSNTGVPMSHVRPFAFHWLRSLDKSKLPFKKSKNV